MKYNELNALQKIDFWTRFYEIDFSAGNPVFMYAIEKDGVQIKKQYLSEHPSKGVEMMLSELEKMNPKAVRDYDKKQVESGVLVIPGVVVPNTNIDFSELPEWANWVTVCKRGKVRAHSMEPKASMNFEWLSDHRSKRILEIEPRADWQTLKFKINRQ